MSYLELSLYGPYMTSIQANKDSLVKNVHNKTENLKYLLEYESKYCSIWILDILLHIFIYGIIG